MSLCEGGASCGKWRAKCATLIQLMKSCKSFQMPPCLRAAYVSKYLPIKWAEESAKLRTIS